MPSRPRAPSFAADESAEPLADAPIPIARSAFGGGGASVAAGQRRSYVDPADGTRWTVVERSPSGSGNDPEGRSLYFVGDGIFRRVRSYPPGWRDLADAELAALSRSR
ncbi:MAG TPA: hypothetical protein VKA84_24845 [Gemmatimonadaceae bacterium]|nr:hypothetical protein [Gemmatimonadaceae bacterium]